MALPVDLLLSRTELPQDGARLNPAHPLAGRFVTAYLPGVSSDNLGFGGPGGIVGNAHSRSAIPAGPTLRLSGSGANATTNRSYGPTPSYPLTMVIVCRQSNNTTTSIAACAASSAISGSYYYIGGGSSTILTFGARNAFGTALALDVTVPADSAGNQAIGQDMVIVAQSLSASDHRICVNSSSVATATTNIGSMVAWDRLLLGQTSGTTGLDVAAVLFAHGGAALTDAQMRQIASHPREVWELFEPQRLQVLVPSSGGGSPWSVSLTESASAADTLTAATTAVVSLLEAASASDILSAATIAAVALSEAASAADAVSETYSSPGAAAVAEAASAADTLTAAAVLLRAIAEAGTGSDALAAATTMVRALTEAAVAADAVTGALPGSWSVSIAELAAAVDAIAGVVAGEELVRAPEDIVLAARARLNGLNLAHPRRHIGNILKG